MNAFLNKISDLISKDMLFASVLPVLLFSLGLLFVLFHILGYNHLIDWYTGLTINSLAFVTFSSLSLVIIFSYVMYSLRDVMLGAWSGDSKIFAWYFYFGRVAHAARYKRLKQEANRLANWTDQNRRLELALRESIVKPGIPVADLKRIIKVIRSLRGGEDDKFIQEFVDDIISLLQRYSRPSLDQVLFEFASKVQEWTIAFKNANPFVFELSKQYELFRTRTATITDKQVWIGSEQEMKLYESIWEMKREKTIASVQELFTRFDAAYQSFSAHSLLTVRLALSEAVHTLCNSYSLQKSFPWLSAYEKIKTASDPSQQPSARIDPGDEKKLIDAIRKIDKSSTGAEITAMIDEVINAYMLYTPDSLATVSLEIDYLNETMKSYGQNGLVAVDQKYGSLGTIKGSRLGNVIQAYNEYSFKRYNIESELFWPRLQKVITKEYQELIQNQKVTLDFAVTCASLSAIFFILCALGPHIYSAPSFWWTLCGTSAFITILFYEMAVFSASNLGQTIRSSYDLFRLELLKSLNLEFPGDTRQEREIWHSYSQFVTYGDSQPLKIEKYEK